VDTGFLAKTEAEERKCPAFELDQLVQIRDVTAEVQGALAGKTGDDANKALHAKEAELQQSCGSDASVRCDVVSLYHGGVYDLYRYKRYTDVRLVFAPEFAIAQFGGDPDNFNFPRFDFDIGLLRLRERQARQQSRVSTVERQRVQGWGPGVCVGESRTHEPGTDGGATGVSAGHRVSVHNPPNGGVSRPVGTIREPGTGASA
jgi:Peptidase S46